MEKVNIKSISTEGVNPNTLEIDKLDSLGIAKLINSEDKTIAHSIENVIDDIAKAIDASYEVLKSGNRVFYIGAGTSGRLGVLDASEMPPTFNVPNNMIIGIIAGGDIALRNPIEGAEDSSTLVIEDLEKYNFNENDLLIGIAASGRTPYVKAGLLYAKELGAKTVSLSTSSNSEIGKIADIKIDAAVGPETITGSTRMKSGTAQKMILNMISTASMVKLGKVYKNWMIDVKASNEKLFERAINMVMEITGEDREKCIAALEQCNYSPKVSIVMIMKNISYEEAKEILKQNNEKLSEVIDEG